MSVYQSLKQRSFFLFLTVLITGALFSHQSIANPLSGQALYSDVIAYANFGEHRTGSLADQKTSQWVQQSLLDEGVDASFQTFELQQYFPIQNELIVAKKSIAVFPHWFPRPTGKPITAPFKPLHEADLSGAIAYLGPEFAGLWYRVDVSALAQQAAEKGALALVVAVPHPSGEIYVRNAAEPWLQAELPIPTAVVAKSADSTITKALKNNEQAILTLKGNVSLNAQAHNVIGTLKRGDRWIVVSTPISGWFQAAGERGGGLALFLGLARWLSTVESDHSILFIANSGHELSYMGAQQSMRSLPSSEKVDLWLHLGASIGARRWRETAEGLQPLEQVHEYNVLFSHPRWLPTAERAFREVDDLTVASTEQLPPENGELVHFIERGYPAMGMVGSHRFFHTPRDLPDVTSEQLLEPYGKAVQRLMEEALGVSSKK